MFDASGRVLLIRRRNPPFQGEFAIPGGFVDVGETVEAAARRELLEEAGIEAGKLHFVGIYSDPARDPRGHTVAVAFAGWMRRKGSALAGDDAVAVEWVANWREQGLAFDHAEILADAERTLGVSRRGKAAAASRRQKSST